MRRIAMAAVLVLVLSLILSSSPATAAGANIVDRTGDGTWRGHTWRVDIYPGEEKSTTLTLYSPSVLSVNVEVTAVPKALDNGNLTFELSHSSFTMLGKTHAEITLSVKASPSATPGVYTAKLKIKSELITPPPAYFKLSPAGWPGMKGVICR